MWYKIDKNVQVSPDGQTYKIGNPPVLVSSIFMEDLTKMVGKKIIRYDEKMQTLVFEVMSNES